MSYQDNNILYYEDEEQSADVEYGDVISISWRGWNAKGVIIGVSCRGWIYFAKYTPSEKTFSRRICLFKQRNTIYYKIGRYVGRSKFKRYRELYEKFNREDEVKNLARSLARVQDENKRNELIDEIINLPEKEFTKLANYLRKGTDKQKDLIATLDTLRVFEEVA